MIDSDSKRTQGRGAQSHPESSRSMLRHMHPHIFEHDIVLQTKGSSTPKLFLYLYLNMILDIML